MVLAHPGSILLTPKCFFSSRVLDGKNEEEPGMIKMPIDLVSPSRGIKITVIAVPSMGKHSTRARNGT